MTISSPNFENLQQFLTWLSEKRIAYKQLSLDIRKTKIEISEKMRRNQDTCLLQNKLISMRNTARDTMEERMAAKIFANDSWEKWMKQKAAA